ncbi:ladderlectin-like [Scomber scombrus]|uniref:ladderlectin-like n=1 Tax=Scomber scombrus TaxID=13677 RepID=UPI002DD98F44|nr:ladderlectin-like [Scomber scombrus]
MKMLAVSLLVCAMMVLTTAGPHIDFRAKLEPLTQQEKALKIERSASCPGGWTGFKSRCFLFVPTSMKWADAEKHCQSHGGNLASVHSFDEHHVIQGAIVRITHSYPKTWLGGSDAEQVDSWFWSDGTTFRFAYWSTGQPDGGMRANCLVMNFGDLYHEDAGCLSAGLCHDGAYHGNEG